MNNDIVNNLFFTDPAGIRRKTEEVYRFQYENNSIYRSFCDKVGNENEVCNNGLFPPFLPIGFFKTHKITSTAFDPEVVFESSGTTQTIPSRHLVKNRHLYESSFTRSFELHYGRADNWCILGLLPSYLERSGSSLVYMVQKFIEQSNHPNSGFYLHNFEALFETLKLLEQNEQKTLLIGVTYALLDFVEKYQLNCRNTVIMETGGMKGRRDELVREQVHEQLKKGFGVTEIHSEYGMTELLSQAYSKGNGLFECPPWMKMFVREEDDPMKLLTEGRGAINIIDLANYYSCSFIATDDVGEVFEDGRFKILGRMDNSDVRGCSLLAL